MSHWIRHAFSILGPAIIVASVVLGPGSIVNNSTVGASFGFSMVWVLFLATLLMIGMVALSAHLGVVYPKSLCEELAERLGRWAAVMVGVTIFIVAAGFQFGNNSGVLAALDPWIGDSVGWQRIILVGLNVMILAFLWGTKTLYRPIEKLMMLLVGMMILAFVGNFLVLLWTRMTGEVVAPTSTTNTDPSEQSWVAVLGVIGTTFSVAGAFYQAYLVKEKGWKLQDLRAGLVDSIAGIAVLGCISLIIMLTAAMSFYGRNVELKSAADVARQLEPLFGPAALVLFSLGIFAASFSSFLVNAMIGGAMLSDGLGFGGQMDRPATRLFTSVALVTGMGVALFVPQDQRLGLIILAQAMVVIGFPLLALALIYLATRPELTGKRRVPIPLLIVAMLGLVVVSFSAYQLIGKISASLNKFLP